jgi:hypothetical protein
MSQITLHTDRGNRAHLGFSGRLDRFVTDVAGSEQDKVVRKPKACKTTHSPVDIGKDTGLFAPHGSRQNDVGELRRLVLKDILCNDLRIATK